MAFGGTQFFISFENFLKSFGEDVPNVIQATQPTWDGKVTTFELYDNNMWNEVVCIAEDCGERVEEMF